MRVLRASPVGLVSLAFVLALTTPASADHTTVEADWTAPGDDAAVGEVVEADVDIVVDVSFTAPLVDSNVKDWQVQLGEATGESVGVLCSLGYSGLGTDTARVDFTWDSRSHPSGTVNTECDEGAAANVDPARPLANAEYLLRLRARDHVLSTEWHDDDFAIRVNNPPAAPQGVTATFDADAQTVAVAWSANAEPDVSGYVVQQCRTDSTSKACTAGDWATMAEHDAGTVEATLVVADPGVYRYRAVARRPDWSQTAVLSSEPTNASSPVVLEATDPADAGGEADPDEGSESSSTLPEQVTSPDGGSGSGSGGGERGRSLGPRLVQRTEGFDFGFDETLPYGAQPVEEARPRSRDVLVGPDGSGNLLVPIAGGLAVFVFSMQLRYLGRRAIRAVGGPALELMGDDQLASSDDATPPEAGPPPEAAVPTFRPLLGGSGADGPGSFIANWRRWLPDERV